MTLNDFKNKYLGKQVEYHSYGAGAYNQCVDLVNAYINQVLDNSTKDYTEIIGTNAKDFATKYDKEDFEWIPNTPTGVPQAGDIIVWNGNVGGGAGHVAIFLSGGVNAFQSLDQNWSQVERVTLETHNYNNVSGWLRPLKAQAPATITIETKLFEELVRDATLWKDEHPKTLKLLHDNEETNKQKDGQIAELKTTIEQQQSTIDAQTKDIEKKGKEIEYLQEQVDKCNEQQENPPTTGTDTPSTQIPAEDASEANTEPSGGILDRLSRFLARLGF
jgi:hypothetical protein